MNREKELNVKVQQSTLHLEVTAFNKEQVQGFLDILMERSGIQVALAGRSNVGKSSLVNALARRKALAKTSGTPGKTRSINFYRVDPDGFSLVDLPGYGYARCSQEERRGWAKLIDYYFDRSPLLRGLVLLLDCRLPPQSLDCNLAHFAIDMKIPLLPVLTKADKCKQSEQRKLQVEWQGLLGVEPLVVSAKKMKGLHHLWAAIRSLAGCSL